ncbi:MAG: hypothetical protein DDT19_01095 [Syntrophomonadaceae bacterium]|nr:hypothetical protein [Bacillota bacterium]
MTYNKYRNKITEVDGIKFQSRREADYYCELLLRLRAREGIVAFELQPEFVLLNPFTDAMGTKHKVIKYRADFLVIYTDGGKEVVDVKGAKTKEYLIKKKLFLAKYPEFKFTEV